MKVNTTQPFRLICSIYQHEFLGYLFQSFLVQLDSSGRISYQYQTISTQNWEEFLPKFSTEEQEIIRLIEKIQPESIAKFYTNHGNINNPSTKKINVDDFFLKHYAPKDKEKPHAHEEIRKQIEHRIEDCKQKILTLLGDSPIYITGKDGFPSWKEIEHKSGIANVKFHFYRNSENLHYFPELFYDHQQFTPKSQKTTPESTDIEKLDFYQKENTFVLANRPAYLVISDQKLEDSHNNNKNNNNKNKGICTLYKFPHNVEGKKIVPFLQKKFINVPKQMEETYFQKFVAPIIANFDFHVKGFEVKNYANKGKAILHFSEIYLSTSDMFSEDKKGDYDILFELNFQYEEYILPYFYVTDEVYQPKKYEVKFIKDDTKNIHNDKYYTFYKIKRRIVYEKRVFETLQSWGLLLDKDKGKIQLPKNKAFGWLAEFMPRFVEHNIHILPIKEDGKRFFLGETQFSLEIKEKNDWFDLLANIRFGQYEMPFLALRKLILEGKTEFILPNGEIAVIPEIWLSRYADLFHFVQEDKETNVLILKKHHISLVEELEQKEYAQVKLNRKLQKFHNFEEIKDYALPDGFEGTLRPYQQAGYNWLRFLEEYHLGGCLADDMGLGKTIMTLALLQAQKEKHKEAKVSPTLLIIPTSLIYNWELEAKKFTPNLKVLVHTGQQRRKGNLNHFDHQDLIITSYGIVRADVEILQKYYFHYIILDESQAIKNPTSNVSQAVRLLRSQHKLILTGTPLENSTLDLWAQMSFINDGILGTQTFFKQEFLIPIEKKQDESKLHKLGKIIKPFILRRLKSQVAKDLPEKIENVQYCQMTPLQEAYYEKIKAQYRNEILRQIEEQGIAKSQLLVLQGLTKLRQIANHPLMIDEHYTGDSGKLETILYKLESLLSEGHKVLVFSQFVKHLTIFKDIFTEKKWQYAYLDGGTHARQQEVEKFQTQENIKIFLISLKAGGVGLNLTSADYVFLLDPWWNPAVEAQAVDRAHRIGQKNTVFTYKFISQNTVEEKILALQQHKKLLANELISTEDSFVKTLTKEDILSLLE